MTRPEIVMAAIIAQTSAHIFFGGYKRTFFAQFQNNTNLYVALRYGF